MLSTAGLNKYCSMLILLLLISSGIMAQRGAWTKLAQLPTSRVGASASLVNDKIYVIGGYIGSDLAANEMYDPTLNTWTAKKEMPTKRAFLSTAVVNGIIYAIGGGYPSPTKVVEAYDPATDTWTTKADMLSKRFGARAVVVDGIIYNIGGNYYEGNCEAYDPKTNTWTSKTPMPGVGGKVSATVFNGLIYVFGGGDKGPAVSNVYVYDPKTDTWTKKKDMPTARFGFQTYLVDGKIYAMGGCQVETQAFPVVEMYDPATDSWTIKADMPFNCALFAGAVVNGKIYLFGGTADFKTGGEAVWEFDPSIQTFIPAGNVSGTWTKLKSPYYINGEITIPKDLTLTIESGVQIVFTGYYKFNVQGRLLAIGTKTDSIRFTAQDKQAGWHGLRFDQTKSTNDTSRLYYCSFKYGKAIIGDDYGGLDRAGGSILINEFDKVLVSDCLFESNMNIGTSELTGGAAIFIQRASPTVQKSMFRFNSGTTDAAITISYASNAIVRNNIFSQNSAQWCVIACRYTSDNKPLISGNIISDNTSIQGGGGIFCRNSYARIENNIIVHNQGSAGAVICYDNSIPVIINNTFADNKATLGGGVYCDLNSDPIFINNIIYGNSAQEGSQVYINDDLSNPDFLYCDIQGGMEGFAGAGAGTAYAGIYKNNINKDPALLTAPLNFYELAGNSPCLSAGTESAEVSGIMYYAPKFCIRGNARPNPAFTKPDQGACESSNGVVGVERTATVPKEFSLSQNYPNPFNPGTVITYQLPVSSQVTLKVYDALGNEIATLVNELKPEGTYNISWNAENLSSGIYFYQIKAGSYIQTKKMILLR